LGYIKEPITANAFFGSDDSSLGYMKEPPPSLAAMILSPASLSEATHHFAAAGCEPAAASATAVEGWNGKFSRHFF
jgi:hypothetical protein